MVKQSPYKDDSRLLVGVKVGDVQKEAMAMLGRRLTLAEVEEVDDALDDTSAAMWLIVEDAVAEIGRDRFVNPLP